MRRFLVTALAALAELRRGGGGSIGRLTEGGGNAEVRPAQPQGGGEGSGYRGARGLDPAVVKDIEKAFGFDKPAPERFALLVWNFISFDFGKSYFRDISVIELIKEKMPVSI